MMETSETSSFFDDFLLHGAFSKAGFEPFIFINSRPLKSNFVTADLETRQICVFFQANGC